MRVVDQSGRRGSSLNRPGGRHMASGGSVFSDEEVGLGQSKHGSGLSDEEVGFPVSKSEPQSSLRSVALQVPTGFNEGLATFAGAPVDAMTWALNKGIRGVNAAANAAGYNSQSPEAQRAPLINEIRHPFGGSESIKGAMGYINANPDNAPARTPAERIARGTGEGVSMVVAPGGVIGGIERAGMAVPALVRTVFGAGETLPTVAANSVIGGTAGGAGKTAAEFVPDEYKPLAEMGGNLFGAGIGASALAGARGIGSLGDIARDYLSPLTAAGQERAAGRVLADRSSNPAALRDALENPSPELLRGSKPTTFQQTGDMGLGSLEREVATANPADFMQRRAEQNVVRNSELRGIAENGSPEDVASALRQQFQNLDSQTSQAMDRAVADARARAEAIGGHGTPEEYGAALRTAVGEAREAAKRQERALWSAVDPDGTLALPIGTVKQAAAKIRSSIPGTARPLAGEEREIFDLAKSLKPVLKFNDLAAYRSRVSAAMREELMTQGRSPAYARLTQLRNAIEDAIGSTIEKQSKQDQRAIERGQLSPEQSIAARIKATTNQNAPRAGNEVFTPSGRRVGINYRIADADDLITSHTHDMALNPAYPQELQPRDRTRAASEMQIGNMAADLQPERLGASSSAAEGAPIVGPGGIVESGNARTLAIRRALAENGPSGKAYRQYLESQGYDTTGIRNPVLVRQRTTELKPAERIQFTQEANASPGLALSASERAASDAQRLPSDVLDLYRDGDLNNAENRDFVRAFARTVPERGEEGAFATSGGALSLEGARRIENALLHAAYNDSGLVARIAESGDDNIRSMGRALTDVAGEMAQLRGQIQSGAIAPQTDIVPSLMQAVALVGEARAKQIPLAMSIAQRDAFSPINPVTELLLRDAYGPDFAGRLNRGSFTELLRDYIREARQQTTEARLFGEPASAEEILQSVSARHAGQSRSRAAAAPLGEGNGASGLEGGRPNPTETRARGAGEGAGASILDEATPTANFDEAARERLKAATEATRERVQTFDKGPVGSILRSAGMQGQYRTLDASVPGAVFRRGPLGAQTVAAFRKAVGDHDAIRILGDYAASSLRQAAGRPDGTIDPVRIANWQKAHADALRAIPDLRGRFADAAAAAQSIEDFGAIRREVLDQYQRGAIGKLLGAQSSDEITRIVGGIFGQKDAARQMQRLVAETKHDPAARDGLRKSVIDYISNKFVSNTEAATSSENLLRSDQFQNFIRQNAPALHRVLSEEQVNSLRAIAADLHRANRSVTAVKLPGGSNTAQDQASAKVSLLSKLVRHAAETTAVATTGAVGGGPLGGLVGLVGGIVASAMREAGMKNVDDLVKAAMLNPEIARKLLAKAPTNNRSVNAISLAAAIRRAASGPALNLVFGTSQGNR